MAMEDALAEAIMNLARSAAIRIPILVQIDTTMNLVRLISRNSSFFFPVSAPFSLDNLNVDVVIAAKVTRLETLIRT